MDSRLIENLLRLLRKELETAAPAGEPDRFVLPLERVDPHAVRGTLSLPTPGLRHLPRALEAAVAGPGAHLTHALAPLLPHLYWSCCYARSPWSVPFRDDLAVGELIGQRGPVASAELALGVVLLGPRTLYPPHAHPATELYYLLGGTPLFRCGEGPWRSRPPGSLIVHDSDRLHALRTEGEPMLALFAWGGKIDGSIWRPGRNGRTVEQRI